MSGVALEAFPLKPLAQKLAMTTNGFSSFARALFRRFFEMPTKLHFAEDAFALHLLFQSAKCLVNVVVAYGNLHCFHHLSGSIELSNGNRYHFRGAFPAVTSV